MRDASTKLNKLKQWNNDDTSIERNKHTNKKTYNHKNREEDDDDSTETMTKKSPS